MIHSDIALCQRYGSKEIQSTLSGFVNMSGFLTGSREVRPEVRPEVQVSLEMIVTMIHQLHPHLLEIQDLVDQSRLSVHPIPTTSSDQQASVMKNGLHRKPFPIPFALRTKPVRLRLLKLFTLPIR